ncbi:relaxase domain-containing protein [Streptomyces sp. NPDC017086]|uniref:relaxase domain-containing protein n=1 Tax=Streptomyces sp. NPDC017086 TaxID=3364976 RepID=UPI0037B3186C
MIWRFRTSSQWREMLGEVVLKRRRGSWITARVQRLGAGGEPVWGAVDTYRLYQNAVAAGTLYTLAMTTEVCETLGLATVPREVTPGLRPVMEIAGVPEDLIDWSASRRQRIEDALEVLTDQYVKDHGHLPSECGRHQLGWWAAQETRPAKKKPKPLAQLLAWWRASAILRFGQQLIDGLLDRCRAVGAAVRARVDPTVDVTLAAVDVAAVVPQTTCRRPRGFSRQSGRQGPVRMSWVPMRRQMTCGVPGRHAGPYSHVARPAGPVPMDQVSS